MENLITITTNEQGSSVVSARDLHAYLGAGSNMNTWFKNQVDRAMLEQGTDFIQISEQTSKGSTGGRPSIDYALTLSSAKEISMLNGGEKGKQARTYFLECEKIAKESIKQLSPAEQLLANAQLLVDIERKQRETENRISKTEQEVLELKAKTQTRSDYFTVAGFATLNKINCGLKLASSLGKQATSLCTQRNIPTETLPDPRFGVVKRYPVTILEEVFNVNIAN